MLFVYVELQPVIVTFVGADGGILAVVTYKEYKEFGREDNAPTPEQLMLDTWISYKVAYVKPGIVYAVARGVPLVVVLYEYVGGIIEPVDDISVQ